MLKIVPPPENRNDQDQLLKLAHVIREALKAKQNHDRNALRSALQAGAALNEAQKLVAPGYWKGWLRENCLLSKRTAELYQQLAHHGKEIEDEIDRLGELSLRAARRLIAKPSTSTSTTAHPKGPKPAPIRLSPELWNSATPGEQQSLLESILASIPLPALLAAMPAGLKEQLERRALASAKLRRTVVNPSKKPVTVEDQVTQALRIVLCTTAAIGERKGAFRSIERTLANEDTSFTANDLEVVIPDQAGNKAAKKAA